MTARRSYTLSHIVKEEEAAEIERELREVGDFRSIAFSKDYQSVNVEVSNGNFPEVMTAAVNIFSRVSNECELKYDFSCRERPYQ